MDARTVDRKSASSTMNNLACAVVWKDNDVGPSSLKSTNIDRLTMSSIIHHTVLSITRRMRERSTDVVRETMCNTKSLLQCLEVGGGGVRSEVPG